MAMPRRAADWPGWRAARLQRATAASRARCDDVGDAGLQVPLVDALRRVGPRLRRGRQRCFQHRVSYIAAAHRISLRQRSEIHVVGERCA